MGVGERNGHSRQGEQLEVVKTAVIRVCKGLSMAGMKSKCEGGVGWKAGKGGRHQIMKPALNT